MLLLYRHYYYCYYRCSVCIIIQISFVLFSSHYFILPELLSPFVRNSQLNYTHCNVRCNIDLSKKEKDRRHQLCKKSKLFLLFYFLSRTKFKEKQSTCLNTQQKRERERERERARSRQTFYMATKPCVSFIRRISRSRSRLPFPITSTFGHE